MLIRSEDSRDHTLPSGPAPAPARRDTISTMRVLDATGDSTVRWDRERLAAGDPEARAAVEEAERIFAQARARGAQAFRLRPGQPAERLEQLDRQAQDILVIPPMVGG